MTATQPPLAVALAETAAETPVSLGSWNLPVPATFIIDRGGTIAARFVEMDFTKRMEPADVVSALAEINWSGR
jgi:peroxiredoxin